MLQWRPSTAKKKRTYLHVRPCSEALGEGKGHNSTHSTFLLWLFLPHLPSVLFLPPGRISHPHLYALIGAFLKDHQDRYLAFRLCAYFPYEMVSSLERGSMRSSSVSSRPRRMPSAWVVLGICLLNRWGREGMRFFMKKLVEVHPPEFPGDPHHQFVNAAWSPFCQSFPLLTE